MTRRVGTHPVEDDRVCFNSTKERVARRAERTAHSPRRVAMVHEQFAFDAADQAPAILRSLHRRHIVGGEPVLAHIPGPEVLRSSSIGVGSTPFLKTLIASSLVFLRVLPRALVRAVLAVGPEVLARLTEAIDGKRLAAAGARLGRHRFSVACQRDNTRELGQPCHADVLLELANGGV